MKKVALICPASRALHKDDPQKAKDLLASKYKIDACFKEETFKPCSPKRRAEIFLDYLFDDSIDILWALRGGEGTADIMPFIHKHHKSIKKLKQKPIIGFSDITTLLVYFSQEFGWKTVHGPGAGQLLGKNKLTQKSIDTVIQTIRKPEPLKALSSLTPLNQHCKQSIKGKLIGGNLVVLGFSIGDIWEIQTRNKIVLLEDIEEKPHAIHRNLTYLERMGKFKQAKAIVFGDFYTGNPPELKAPILKTLKRFAKESKIPVFKTDQFGHGKKNLCLTFNTLVELRT